jgi:hypothetical protein
VSAGSVPGTPKYFVQGRPARLLNEAAEEVLLKRLSRLYGPAPQHVVDIVWNILDLNAWHTSRA